MSGSEALNLEKAEFSNEGKGATSTASCSICLELVLNQGDRSIARLQCGHEFHLAYYLNPRFQYSVPGIDMDDELLAALRNVIYKIVPDPEIASLCIQETKPFREGTDSFGVSTAIVSKKKMNPDCIGSAFNAKGAMQCPNCRKVEKGRWLYASGHRSSSDFDFDGWVTEDIYDLGYSELPFGIQWCPFRGFTQLASLFEEGEPQPNSYHELMGNPAYGDHSSASSSSHVCPYLAMHGFPHAVHAAPSSSVDSLPENAPFHRHPTSMGGQSSADMINSHSFPATEPQNSNWQQQHSFSFPLSGNNDQSASQFGFRLPRNDTSSQQRLGSFVHPHPLMHGSVSRNGNNLLASLGTPVMGEARGHTRGPGNHIYQQSLSSLSMRPSPFAPIRRMRPRGVTLISSVAASSSAEMGGFYGFSVSGSVSRNHQEGENIGGRHIDRFYGWGREGFTPLPWIPVEGESQWWGPFNPNQSPQPGSFGQRTAAERVTQSRPENGFQRMPPPRMPPYM